MLTLIVKLYKTISIKYNLKQNITVLSSISHGFLNILTADMVHDLKIARSKRSLQISNHLLNITENSLDESSLYPHDTTGISSNSTGITSPLPFYTKRPTRISKMTRFKFFLKRKQYSNQKPNTGQSTSTTSSSLPHYYSVTTNPNDYLLNTSPVDYEMDTPVRIYFKPNYSFSPPSFQSDRSDFFTPPEKLIVEQLLIYLLAPLQHFSSILSHSPSSTRNRNNTQSPNNYPRSCVSSTNS